MSKATPRNTNKAIRRPRCKYCQKQFRTTSIKKAYCTPECQKEATKKKRRVCQLAKATASAFFYHLAYECERAGTLQILTGHTIESLVQLYEIYKLRLKANRYGATKDFAISHIHPVRSDSAETIGLFHPENLVVAPSKLNHAHSTQHFGGGLSIERKALAPSFQVEKGSPRKQTIQRIIAFLGADVVEAVVRIAKIQPTQRHKVLSWLHDNLNPTVPEHRTWLEQLDDLTTIALTGLKAMLEDKESTGFSIKTRTYTQFEVLLLGIAQQTQYRPELIEVQHTINTAMEAFISANYSADWMVDRTLADVIQLLPDTIMTEPELQALFDVLHGKEISDIHPMLDSFTKRCKERQADLAEPISYKAQQPVLLATLSFAAEARSFAECLDGEEAGAVPVPVLVLASPQAYSVPQLVDALPWD